ncbi:MAG: cobyrinate a,c-diamide synthase [Clostridia bacterium]|nr:cobyrinate a,c-diamide synthase [Clostridia bacterium]
MTGVSCTNLDPFFCGEDLLKYLLCENAGERLTVIEGVMGYYDGTGESGSDNSTYTVAKLTKTPTVLVIDAKGASTSLIATLEGFMNYTSDSGIVGVLFSLISPMNYLNIKSKINSRFGARVAPVGYIPELDDDCLIPSRHLGLVSAPEIGDIEEKMSKIADICEKTIDIDALVLLADAAEELSFKAPAIPRLEPIKIAVAFDRAFFFYYRDTLRLLEKMGAEIKFFSPLGNEPIPCGCSGLLIGGGYPELYAERFEANTIAKNSVAEAIRNGMPTVAECGGFQYLGDELCGKKMCGVLSHKSHAAGKLVRFGYVTLRSKKDGLLGSAGTTLRGHEFHYYDSTLSGDDFTATKPSGKTWKCAVMTETMYAGYPHLYLYSNIESAEAFYKKCVEYGEREK